jgi:hypothetical protein
MPDRTHGMQGQSENVSVEEKPNTILVKQANGYSFVDLNVINRKLLYMHNKLSIPCRN